MTARTLSIAAVAALFSWACEELPTEPEPETLSAALESSPPPQAEAETPSPPQQEGMGLWGLGMGLPGPSAEDDEPIVAEVEPAPERVAWTLSETALRHYLDWQKHLADSEALAELAQRVVDDDTYPEALRRRAADFTEPESPARSFARFGLSREEVQHAQQLCADLSDLRYLRPPQAGIAELRARASSSERLFLGAVQDHDDRTLRESAASLRAVYGDETVELLLKYQASLPADVTLLEDAEAALEAAPASEAEAEEAGL